MITKPSENPASQILLHYLHLLDRFYGMYIDACMGFEAVGQRMAQGISTDQYHKRVFLGEFDDPNQPDAKYNHSTTIGDFIGRNHKDGGNQLLLSQSLIVFIYSIWDSMVRPLYCSALNKSQDEVTCDIMGDLRLYRHAIAHNNLTLQKPTLRLSFVAVGKPVLLNRNQVNELFTFLFDDLNDLNFAHTGERLNLPFYRQLNRSASTS